MSSPVRVQPVSIVSSPLPMQSIHFDSKEIGRFGFKNPGDMTAFLKSESGIIAQSIAAEVVNEQIMQQKQQEIDYLKFLERRAAMIASLLLGLAYKKSAHAKLIDSANQQIKKIKERASTSTHQQAETEYHDALASYQRTLDAMNDARNTMDKKANALEEELSKLAKDEDRMERQHELFDDALNNVLNLSPEALEEELDTVDSQLEKMLLEVDELLKMGKDDEAHDLIDRHNAKIARRATAMELLDIKKETPANKYYNDKGETTTDPTKHTFVVPQEMELVRDPNSKEFMLLKAGTLNEHKSFDALPNDVKEMAKLEFTRKQPALLAVRPTIAQKKKGEREAFEQRSKPVIERAERLQQTVITLENQCRDIQAGLSQLQQIPFPSPQPQPSAARNQTAAKPADVSPTATYRHLLNLMQLKPTADQVHRFEDQIRHDRGRDLTPQEKKELQTIKPGQRINPDQMAKIMNLLNNTGATVTSQQQEVRSVNTPLKTTPSPIRIPK